MLCFMSNEVVDPPVDIKESLVRQEIIATVMVFVALTLPQQRAA